MVIKVQKFKFLKLETFTCFLLLENKDPKYRAFHQDTQACSVGHLSTAVVGRMSDVSVIRNIATKNSCNLSLNFYSH